MSRKRQKMILGTIRPICSILTARGKPVTLASLAETSCHRQRFLIPFFEIVSTLVFPRSTQQKSPLNPFSLFPRVGQIKEQIRTSLPRGICITSWFRCHRNATSLPMGQTQALAGSSPDSGVIFVATSTSNKVAVLRTLPEIPAAPMRPRCGICSRRMNWSARRRNGLR